MKEERPSESQGPKPKAGSSISVWLQPAESAESAESAVVNFKNAVGAVNKPKSRYLYRQGKRLHSVALLQSSPWIATHPLNTNKNEDSWVERSQRVNDLKTPR